MKPNSVLKFAGYGAWNGGTPVNNTDFEKMGMFFKGGVPVNNQTIEARIGVRTRMAAPKDVRIGQVALRNLLKESNIEPSRIKVLIGATNVGDDKYDPGPLIRHPFGIVENACPEAIAFDLYAGCPGFNVAVELVFMLSLSGVLKTDDISVVVGAENLHRAKPFQPDDTSNIIFGDDALATALETQISLQPIGRYSCKWAKHPFTHNFVTDIAGLIVELNGSKRIDGIIIDNQIGLLLHRVPATAARVQSALAEKLYPRETAAGIFNNFKTALEFYDQKIRSFAFDIMSLNPTPDLVETIARAYVESGRYRTVASVYLNPHKGITVKIHAGTGYTFQRPLYGIIDTSTRTHGCFGDYIQAVPFEGDVFGEMDGKGVFLYAVRGARKHVAELLNRNGLSLNDIELLIEHQANFAMIPMTINKLMENSPPDLNLNVTEFIANKMLTNIQTRGNCSVVCMQRLPYDLQHDVLKEDTIQGYPVNRNLKALKKAGLILNDSVGAGMTRSSFLLRTDIHK